MKDSSEALNLVELVVEQISEQAEINPKYVREKILGSVPEHFPSEHLGIEDLRSIALGYLDQLFLEDDELH